MITQINRKTINKRKRTSGKVKWKVNYGKKITKNKKTRKDK